MPLLQLTADFILVVHT